MTVEVRNEQQLEEAEAPPQLTHVEYHHDDVAQTAESEAASPAETRKSVPAQAQPKVGRNDPCPCGSGKKYKHCHGRLS